MDLLPLSMLGVFVGFFICFNFKRTICKQRVKILTRHHIKLCLIWICTRLIEIMFDVLKQIDFIDAIVNDTFFL